MVKRPLGKQEIRGGGGGGGGAQTPLQPCR